VPADGLSVETFHPLGDDFQWKSVMCDTAWHTESVPRAVASGAPGAVRLVKRRSLPLAVLIFIRWEMIFNGNQSCAILLGTPNQYRER
jgi:hypothetical protein